MLTSPTPVSSSSTTITIRWSAWNETHDRGTPPVVSYNLYHKLSNNSDWKEAIPYDSVDGQDEYYATVKNLSPDTLYDFSVAAVREGYGGEGPKSPPLELQRTKSFEDLEEYLSIEEDYVKRPQNHENAGFRAPHVYDYAEEVHINRAGTSHQDVKLQQQYVKYENVKEKPTDSSGHVIPTYSTSLEDPLKK
ncbi:hypothetical protein HOLleu_44956 [Holothuria leucospilota]|uniref:Fibronectin type-III domain-containing protein n=1 Tax=Holothuria leucospilota TaxID=206669 RepID=A0A9Q0YAB7_HOLLE|nr:hypothetical protein HOLleu_44956 [Holothuria leucospilota]